MKAVTQLEIEILHLDNEGCITTFFELTHGHALWDYTKESVEDIWNADGGLEVTINGYNTILSTVQFHHLLQVINFLLLSICCIRKIELEKDLIFFDFPDGDVIYQSLDTAFRNTHIELDLSNEDYLLLSYKSNADKRSTRYERTFDNITIGKDIWVLEAKNALEDFFIIYKQLYDNGKRNEAMYTNYLKLWERVKTSLA